MNVKVRKKFFNKKNLCILSFIFIFISYTIISFINLGDFKFPKTTWTSDKNKRAIFYFDKITNVSKLQYLPYYCNDQIFDIYYTCDYKTWESIKNIKLVHFDTFTWGEIDLNVNAICFNIISHYNNLSLLEVAFRDSKNNLISYNTNEENLRDEQNIVPEIRTYKNSMYFDEIYHARTANEIINKPYIYERTHPPLGKFIISLGIRLFGMNPFGWRIMGNLFGILMLPLIFLFSKSIFGGMFWPIFTTLIFTFDFMHFAQTRIATLDSFLTFFIIAMYYFMYKYYSSTFSNTKNKDFVYLGLSGIFMGLAIATKWQGVFGAFGLSVIFFISIFNKCKEYLSLTYKGEKYYKKQNLLFFLIKTFSFCIIFFIIIPISIYFLSYLSYFGAPNFNNIKDILNNQYYMYNFHSTLEGNHYYASKWWEWPILLKPILYYAQTIGDKKSAISSFGNPLVWFFGILSFFYVLFYCIEKKSKKCLFLLIAYISQYAPWIFIKREAFIYHYFPSVPFITLIITFTFKELFDKMHKSLKYIYLFFVIFLFIMFYPVLSGYPINISYANNFLKWFSGWVLVY